MAPAVDVYKYKESVQRFSELFSLSDGHDLYRQENLDLQFAHVG